MFEGCLSVTLWSVAEALRGVNDALMTNTVVARSMSSDKHLLFALQRFSQIDRLQVLTNSQPREDILKI